MTLSQAIATTRRPGSSSGLSLLRPGGFFRQYTLQQKEGQRNDHNTLNTILMLFVSIATVKWWYRCFELFLLGQKKVRQQINCVAIRFVRITTMYICCGKTSLQKENEIASKISIKLEHKKHLKK